MRWRLLCALGWCACGTLVLSAPEGSTLAPRPAAAQSHRGGDEPSPTPSHVPGTTVQLPEFGVAIDADGVLTMKMAPDLGGVLKAKRAAAAKARLPGDVAAYSPLRKISLVRLERALRAQLAKGEPPTEDMRFLAGLQRVQYVFLLPESGDLVIAGPAEGWLADGAGRVIGVSTARPVVLLEDLAVALRAFAPGSRGRVYVGCSIDPTREGLAKLQEFQRTIPRSISAAERGPAAAGIARGMVDSLGRANIRVFGVSERTHLAQVLVEADYRMKRVGIGLEPPPVEMATFIGSLKGAGDGVLQRWWFTPNYECLRVTEDRLGCELVGQGVQLLGEDKRIGPDGALAAGPAKPSLASELFTLAFTRKYPDIAARSPVYAQMRNCVDLLVAAAFLRHEDYAGRLDWKLGVLGDEALLPTETQPAPKQVACVVNSVWKGARLLTPAGGGVSIRPEEALRPERLLPDERGQLAARRAATRAPEGERWWWD